MEKVFARSAETHRRSMDEISKSMTLPRAMEALRRSKLSRADAELEKVTNLLTGGSKHLRHKNDKNDGFGGLNGARLLLNDMIYESMEKYDAEIAKCTDYYAKQCALMEVARGAISASNAIAANSRTLILDAQTNINKCETDIPETKMELKNHNSKCRNELSKMNARLRVLMDDIAIMTMILEMSDCDAKFFVQTQKLAMLKCKDQCTNKEFVTFNHNLLQHQVDKLKSPASRDMLAATFADLFDDAEPGDSVQFLQA